MTREEREKFVREVLDTNIANAVQAIVDRWEDDREDARQEGIALGQDSVPWNWSYE